LQTKPIKKVINYKQERLDEEKRLVSMIPGNWKLCIRSKIKYPKKTGKVSFQNIQRAGVLSKITTNELFTIFNVQLCSLRLLKIFFFWV